MDKCDELCAISRRNGGFTHHILLLQDMKPHTDLSKNTLAHNDNEADVLKLARFNQLFIVEDNGLKTFAQEKEILSAVEIDEFVLANAEFVLGFKTLVLDDRDRGLGRSGIPNKLLVDISNPNKPVLYIVETLLFDDGMGEIFSRITYFLELFNHSEATRHLLVMIRGNPTVKKSLSKIFPDISRFISLITIGKPQVILLIGNNGRRDILRIRENYPDSWGTFVKPIVIRKYTTEIKTFYAVSKWFW